MTTKKTSYSSMGKISLRLIFQEILRPKAQNLGISEVQKMFSVMPSKKDYYNKKSLKKYIILLGK